MLTAYDFTSARILDQAGVDGILVGDSLGMTTLGYSSTLPVTMDDMIRHTQAVRRGAAHVFLIGDMPYMSYQVSPEQALTSAGRIVKEGGADCVKLEGGVHVADTVLKIVQAGIPVIGHIGLTPQSASALFAGGAKHVPLAISVVGSQQLRRPSGPPDLSPEPF